MPTRPAREFKASKYISTYSRQRPFVNHYYFYLQDKDFGPAFIKVCSYAPYAVKICLNGNEWAKRQLLQRSISFEPLDNGFLSCEDPDTLQEVCDQLGPDQFQAFFTKWQSWLPWRLTTEDQRAGYQYCLSIWQVEFSRTQVFDVQDVAGKKGIIWRIPNSYRYRLTTYGLKVALFFTKLDARIFRRLLAASDSSQPVPLPLAAAFEQVDQAANRVSQPCSFGALGGMILVSFVKDQAYEDV